MHIICEMTVDIQRERSCCVTDSALHRLYIVAILEAQYCEGMPEIMNPCVRSARPLHNLLVMIIKRLRVYMLSNCACERYPCAALFFVLPALPLMIAANTCTEKMSNEKLDNLILENFRLLDDHNKALVLYTAEKLLTMTEKEFDEAKKDIMAFYKQL